MPIEHLRRVDRPALPSPVQIARERHTDHGKPARFVRGAFHLLSSLAALLLVLRLLLPRSLLTLLAD
jgi:hypothetical protein